MSFVSGVQDPKPSPLLPTEAAALESAGKDPNDYMGLWVQAIADERGISIGATHEGLTFCTVQGVMRSAALVSPSKLILTPTNAVTLDLAMYGIRLVLAKTSCELPAVPDWGWEVGVEVANDWVPPAPLIGRCTWSNVSLHASTGIFTTLTLYEAQAIRNLLGAAGITSTMRPLPKPAETASTDSGAEAAAEPAPTGDQVWMYSQTQGLPAGIAEDRLAGLRDRLAQLAEEDDELK